MNWGTVAISTVIPAVLGMTLGEVVMQRQFTAFQPVLGSMTFLVEEMVGALLIDFPLAFLSAFIFLRMSPPATAADGAIAGARFLTVFIGLVVLMALVGRFTDRLDVFGLAGAVRTAVRAGLEGLGWRFFVMMGLFLAFDYLLCMLGGVLAFHLAVGG